MLGGTLIEVLVEQFVGEVERLCMKPGVRHDRQSYVAYVMQTCYEIARGNQAVNDVTIEMLHATLSAIAPTVPRRSPASIGMDQINIFTHKQLADEWRDFSTRCVDKLDERAKQWPHLINVGGRSVELRDWVEDKQWTTVTLNKTPKRRRGK